MTEPGEDADVLELMEGALAQARLASSAGEVPVGAVVAANGVILGVGHNRSLVDRDPSAHAEIVALRNAALSVGNHRLAGATLVTTLEPCLMCCGAAIQARVARLVHAADDPKAGALDILSRAMDEGRVNHRIELVRGPLAAEASEVLRGFFRARR
jgi:tRNA(adenine34) deaminase